MTLPRPEMFEDWKEWAEQMVVAVQDELDEAARYTQPEEVATGTYALNPAGITRIDSSGGAVAGTLGDGDYVGQIKTIVMVDATTSSTVSVTNHETSDPEVITFAAVDDTAVLLWTGTEWITLKLSGASV